MQRWEYKVLALRGSYTETLNEYGREGWELVSVASDVRGASTPPSTGSSVPMPRALGRLEDAAARLKKLGGDDAAEASEPATSTTLLWVLRRQLNDD
jgi:hypothetical protein